MNRVECFLLERTDLMQVSLRRYAGDEKCPLPHGYHNARVVIVPETPALFEAELEGDDRPGDILHDDPRWPVACGCGYVFQERDTWQTNRGRLYRDPRNGKLAEPGGHGPGAMWRAPWYSGFSPAPADGAHLMVNLPGGDDWCIDGPASSGGFWTRTGVPPLVTVSPSILTPRYHGFLRNGFLEEC